MVRLTDDTPTRRYSFRNLDHDPNDDIENQPPLTKSPSRSHDGLNGHNPASKKPDKPISFDSFPENMHPRRNTSNPYSRPGPDRSSPVAPRARESRTRRNMDPYANAGDTTEDDTYVEERIMKRTRRAGRTNARTGRGSFNEGSRSREHIESRRSSRRRAREDEDDHEEIIVLRRTRRGTQMDTLTAQTISIPSRKTRSSESRDVMSHDYAFRSPKRSTRSAAQSSKNSTSSRKHKLPSPKDTAKAENTGVTTDGDVEMVDYGRIKRATRHSIGKEEMKERSKEEQADRVGDGGEGTDEDTEEEAECPLSIRRSGRIRHNLEKQEEERKISKEKEEEEEEEADQEEEEGQTEETAEETEGEESSEESEEEEEQPCGKRYGLREKRKAPDRLAYNDTKDNSDDDARPRRARPSTTPQSAPRYPHRKRARFTIESDDDSSSDDNIRSKPIKARAEGSRRSSTENNEKRAANARFTPGADPFAVLGGASKAALSGDIAPVKIDPNCDFDSVGGHKQLKNQLKEMILLPLLYPDVFKKFAAKPPKGCLFIGPPGTGKTLLARALATECSKIKGQDVAVYVRNGADVLSKWVGESERQLRMLFEEAQKNAPAIIFFDEIDGLAPTRSSRQDHCHTSIVTTLLALLDGSSNRGDIVVIGATNRADVIDPALRRPGRFDREFHFTLPDEKTRLEIIKIHTKAWSPAPTEQLLLDLARVTGGYCGADLANLCSESAIIGLRRAFPQIYSSQSQLQINAKAIKITAQDFFDAMKKITPSAQRMVHSCAIGAPLPPHLDHLLRDGCDSLYRHVDTNIFPFPRDGKNSNSIVLPPANSILSLRKLCLAGGSASSVMFKARLLLRGNGDFGQKHMVNEFLHHVSSKSQTVKVVSLEASRLIENPVTLLTNAEAEARAHGEKQRTIVYLGDIDELMTSLPEDMLTLLCMMIRRIPHFANTLVLGFRQEKTPSANTSMAASEVPESTDGIEAIFTKHYEVDATVYGDSVEGFLKQIVVDAIMIPPEQDLSEIEQKLPSLPSAPVKPKVIDAKLLEEKERKEEHIMVQLRQFLRETLRDLIRDPRFRVFASPVDKDDVPDYYEFIDHPMDLELVNQKIDTHQYQTARQFLQDIDLICSNALEYNPPGKDPRNIRPKACLLRDTAAQIMIEELDERFEKECERVQEERIKRNATTTKNAPKFYYAGGKGAGYDQDGATKEGGQTHTDSDGTDSECAIVVNGASSKRDQSSATVVEPTAGAQEPINASAFISGDDLELSTEDCSNQSAGTHQFPTAQFEVIKTGSVEWMRLSRQVGQKFDVIRMKAIATATANDALRIGQVCWIEYAGEHYAAKVRSVRLASYHSVDYQISCPSLPDHCKNEWIPASRLCDYIDDGFVEKKFLQPATSSKAKNTKGTPGTSPSKKPRRKKSAWASGIIRKPSKSRQLSGKDTKDSGKESAPCTEQTVKLAGSEALPFSPKSEISAETVKRATSPAKMKSSPLKSPKALPLSGTLEIHSNPLPERRTSARIDHSTKPTTSGEVTVDSHLCKEFLGDLVKQCTCRQLQLPQLESLYSRLSFALERHRDQWDRNACVNDMRLAAIDFFVELDKLPEI